MAETPTTIPAINGQAKEVATEPSIMVIKFADSPIPEFREISNKEYIVYGINNTYPDYLTYQYNKCGKHRAIINGKSRYIFGSGFEGVGGLAPITDTNGTVTPAVAINSAKETMYDVMKKSIKDVEIYGGFRWFISWNQLGQIAAIKHDDYQKFRTGKNGGFFYKEMWNRPNGQPNNKEKEVWYPEFKGQPPLATDEQKVQVFAYNEYGPGCDHYPLPEYIGCANWIDIDIEISKFHLSSLRNGMMPSKMIQFYTGEPEEEKKKAVEKRFKEKFAGSDNAGKFILVFNTNKEKQVTIDDLSANELDKQFEILNKTSQQEIFTGHQVTSPMLFGIKTEGQLGGTTELQIAYQIFINTYAKPKQEDLEKIINYFGEKMGKGSSYKFKQLDPVGLILDIKDFVDKLPTEFVFEKLGIPAKYNPAPVAVPGAPTEQQQSTDVNDNIKNLTAKQHQQLIRIIRQYSKGQLTPEAAKTLLRTGLGLNENDISSILGIANESDTVQMQKFVDEATDDDKVIAMFSACGDMKSDFNIIKSKAVKFSSDAEAIADELEQLQAFKEATLTVSEASILDLIAKDKHITPAVIAETLGTSVDYVEAKIGKLEKAGLLKSVDAKVGTDIIPERVLVKPLSEITGTGNEPTTTEIYVKYSYEGPKDNRNRPFCAKMLALDRIYSRAEIESISARLGYSVWDRRGGWYTLPSGKHREYCRHRWESHIVVRKTVKK